MRGVASDEAVYDVMTGEPLRFEVVSGGEARRDPLMPPFAGETERQRLAERAHENREIVYFVEQPEIPPWSRACPTAAFAWTFGTAAASLDVLIKAKRRVAPFRKPC